MSCQYNYYENDYDLMCKVNGKPCIYRKKCDKVGKFIPNDNQEECYIYNMEKIKNIPKGSKYIVFTKKDYLYVMIDDDHTIKVKNTLGKIDQDYIYLKETIDGYEISLTPFETRKNNVRKNSNEKKRY